MSVFFVSDLHLGHENVLSIRTQFHDIDEHDDFLIEKWNNKVKKHDEVYILGDLSFRSSNPITDYLARMNGKKHLIVGNHDGYWMRKMNHMEIYFQSVEYLKVMKFEKKQLTLCHYPMLEWPGSRYVESGTSFLIHGHIHNETDSQVYSYIKNFQPHALNACVDINNFEPVTFDELKENNKKWYKRDNLF